MMLTDAEQTMGMYIVIVLGVMGPERHKWTLRLFVKGSSCAYPCEMNGYSSVRGREDAGHHDSAEPQTSPFAWGIMGNIVIAVWMRVLG